MNTFWLKIAGIAVVAVVLIILVGTFTGGEDNQPKEPPEEEKGIYDMAERDKNKFLTEPEPVEPDSQDPPSQPDTTVANQTDSPPAQPPKPVQEPPKPVTLYFKPLNEIDEVEASRYLNAATPARSTARFRIGVKNMVDNCRRIIKRWPDSWYAYKAKLMLDDIPERYHEQYKITEQERDVSMFTKPRPGTQPFTDEGSK